MIKKLLTVTHLFVMGLLMLAAGNGKVWSQVKLNSLNTVYNQNFNTLISTGSSSLVPEGWYFVESGTNANTTYTAGTGSSTTGDTYSFGSATSTERALGGLQSGSLTPTIGASFENNTNATITSLRINYTGEQWRLGVASRTEADRLDFQYSLNATSLTTGTWLNDDNLDFIAPLTSGTVGLLDGNQEANRKLITSTINGLSIAPGAVIWIRWNSFDVPSSDDGLAIDDFSFTAIGEETPVIVSVANVSQEEGNSGTTDFIFTITLSKASTEAVTFDIATAHSTANAVDYTARSLTAQTIDAGKTTYEFTVAVNGDTEAEQDETFTVNLSNIQGATPGSLSATGTILNDDKAPLTFIYTIQGSGAVSPLAGQMVTTQGIVVGDFQASNQLNGFFIQDASGDNNSATSDGIFVFVPAANTAFHGLDVEAGQLVEITGTVAEFKGANDAAPGTLTQLTNITGISIQSSGHAISPVVITFPLPGISEFEQYEGMLVNFQQTLTVSQNFTLGRFGEVWLSGGVAYAFTQPDGRLYNPTNFIDPTDNPASGVANNTNNKAEVVAQQNLHTRSSILLDDASSVQNPATIPYLGPDNTLRVGSKVTNLTGIFSYGFNAYRIQPTQAPVFNYALRPLTPPSTGNANLKIASFNVLNYFNGNGSGGGFPTPRGANNLTEFNRQRAKIIAALKALNADVVGLIEMENDGDGDLSAIADLVRGLNEATAEGMYAYTKDAANGGTGTDAIKVAFIYKPAAVTPLGAPMVDMASVHNRPPLAQTFQLTSNGEVVTAVINHFKSKSASGASGADVDQGDGQGAYNATRIQQAQALVQFISNTIIPTAQDQDVIILGDLNAYAEEDPIDVLRAAGFINLFGPESYSYVFDGQSGSLDHALVTSGLAKQFAAGGKWHINADEPIFLDYNTEFKTQAQISGLYQDNAFRSSDHDPVLVGLNLYTPAMGFAVSNVTRNEGSGAYTVEIITDNIPYQNFSIPVTTSAARDVRYGERRDYITNPSAETGSFTISFPAGTTKSTFTVTPLLDDDNEKFAEEITFTLSASANREYKVGPQNTFVFTIQDTKKNTGTKESTLSVSPNPTSGDVMITTAIENANIDATLRSPEGEVLYCGKGEAAEVSRQISQALQGRRGGIYMLQTVIDEHVENTRIVKF